jgi:putative ABC transport system permease protein
MLRNYLTIAFRNLLRHRIFSLVNVFGLAIGMAACLLILQYVRFELSYDRFHAQGSRIYRIPSGSYLAGGALDYIDAGNSPAVGPALKREFPEVADFVRLNPFYDGAVIANGDVKFREEKLYYADPSVLTVFSFPFLKGDCLTALQSPNTVVLTETTARKYFGAEDPVGKVILLNGKKSLMITGVLKDIPVNSHLQFGLLVSFSTFAQGVKENLEENWGWYNFFTYVLLRPQADPKAVEAKLPAFVEKHKGDEMRKNNYWEKFILQPLSDIHLNSSIAYEVDVRGDRKSVYSLAIIAAFILLIAWVNYVNLSTAKATERAKEVGVRKVTGASRSQLIRQFLLESIFLNVLAALLAGLITAIFLPFFGQLVGKTVPFALLDDLPSTLGMLAALGTGTLLSAFYPAFVLSAFKPIFALKGSSSGTRQGAFLRKSLVVFQFAASIALIAGTLVVYQQLEFMRKQEVGMNLAQTLVIRAPNVRDSTYAENKEVFKTELLRNAAVRSATISSDIPGEKIINATGDVWREGAKIRSTGTYALNFVDKDFVPSFQLDLVAGRNFSATDKQAVLLNEAAIQLLGFKSAQEAIQQKITLRDDEKTIIGVVKNFHQESLRNRFEPTILVGSKARSSYFSLKVNPENLAETIAATKATYDRYFPGNPFEYFFLDEFFSRQYQADQQFGRVFGVFTALAIGVAALGLFGLASFMATQRTKEIGIRKVLGATVTNIVGLLSRDFLKLVLIAFLLAIPVAWYTMNQWLQNYAFRIQIGWWVFVLAGIFALFIALLTISYQALNAALANPVKSLRTE